MEKQKTYMGHKIKETKGEKRVRNRGVSARMIWEYKESEVIGKGALEQYFYEYQKMSEEEKNKFREKYEKRLKKG